MMHTKPMSDLYPCTGRWAWRFFAYMFGRDCPLVDHRWTIVEAVGERSDLSGQDVFDLKLVCRSCRLVDHTTRIRVPEILVCGFQITEPARRDLGLARQIASPHTMGVSDPGAPPLPARRPPALRRAAAWATAPLRVAAVTTWRVATAPVRWPYRVLAAWGRAIKKDAFVALAGPVFGVLMLGVTFGGGAFLYLHESEKCEAVQHRGTIETLTPLDKGDYLLEFADGVSFRIHVPLGDKGPLPSEGLAGYVCEKGRFHLDMPAGPTAAPEAPESPEPPAEDF